MGALAIYCTFAYLFLGTAAFDTYQQGEIGKLVAVGVTLIAPLILPPLLGLSWNRRHLH